MRHQLELQKARFIRLADVRARTSLSTRQIYRMMQDGRFPRPVPISPGRVAWLEGAIDEWIAARQRDAAA